MATLDHTRPDDRRAGRSASRRARWTSRSAYVKERKQFGKTAGRVPGPAVHDRRHGDGDRGARGTLVYQAAAAAERGDANKTFLSAAAKCLASDVAMKVTVDAVQLLGGAGYTRDFPVERMMRDAKITQIYEGTNQVQRLVMARSLLR